MDKLNFKSDASNNTKLSDRKKRILTAVIEQHIKTGEPVGSKVLVSGSNISVSSATVRNEMSELSSLGLLEQPHTSAGRVPSSAGYRYYVDNLMPKNEIEPVTKKIIDAAMSTAAGDPEKLIAKAGEILADLTKCACITSAPTSNAMIIKRIEFVPVSTHTAMLLLLTSNGILKSRLCRLDCDISSEMLESFYNITQANIIGRQTGDINTATMQTLAASLDLDYYYLLPLLACVCELAKSTANSKITFGGSSNLFIHKDYGDNIAASLLEFFSKKEPLARLIEESADLLTVKIGEENIFRQLESSSTIVSKYSVNGDNSGAIGIIGPTRMNYEIIIPEIVYLTDKVGDMITKALED